MNAEETRNFLDLAMKRLKRAVDAEDHNRKAAIEDLKFLNGEQWDAKERQKRSQDGRPALMINLLPKYVDQVTGDERHNRPQVKIRPKDSRSDVQIAKIRESLVRDIEYNSSADSIYDQACDMQVSCGIGAWRVLTRYTEDNPFLQEIYLRSLPNPFLVYLDPSAKDANYADAKWGFILEKIPKDEFEERYPKASASASSDSMKVGQGLGYENWYLENLVTVAEYFVKEEKEVWFYQQADGKVFDQDAVDKMLAEWEAKNNAHLGAGGPPEAAPPKPSFVQKRKVTTNKLQHYIITASEILEGPTKVAGKYIPIVLILGKERNIEGKTYRRGLIRDAKDPQKLVNYWETSTAETVALAPKAPWIGTAKQFEGFETDYAIANQENLPFLKYNPDVSAGVLAPPPARNHPGDPPIALFTQRASAHENLKQVIGMFAADIGDRGREVSKAAITQRQKPGDIGTYAFLDNLAKGIAYSGKIINEMIPEVYDTERDIRLRNMDGTETSVPINTTVGSAMNAIKANPEWYKGMDPNKLQQAVAKHGEKASFNDISVGRYSVVVTVGPSYATQRQESVENLFRLTQTSPKLMQLAADLIVENMDFKDADKLAMRFRRTLPPGLAPPQEGDPPMPPMPPPPLVQIQQAKLEVEKAKLQVQKLKALKEGLDAKGEVRKTVLEIMKDVFATDPSGIAPPGGPPLNA